MQNISDIKKEVQIIVNAISNDMHQIESERIGVKTIVSQTFKLVEETRYRDGVEETRYRDGID